MSNITEHDYQTGELIVREMTNAETGQREKDLAKFAKLAQTEANEKTVKEKIKQETLAKLGLTADEVAALLS